ncbi:hypothetical protein OAL67_00670 [bacterium]|nr:hypothetical protein [bacterium]
MTRILAKIQQNLIVEAMFYFMIPATMIVQTAGGVGVVETKISLDQPQIEISSERAKKVKALESFFDKYNSPLKSHAETFVEVAEKHDIDFKLLPAISCMESGCGKQLIPGSYNPFGWGIYGNNAIWFENYDQAIEVVGEGLNENYFARGLDTIDEIAPVYTPPNSANWRNGVSFFINQMDEVEIRELAKDTILASSLVK